MKRDYVTLECPHCRTRNCFLDLREDLVFHAKCDGCRKPIRISYFPDRDPIITAAGNPRATNGD